MDSPSYQNLLNSKKSTNNTKPQSYLASTSATEFVSCGLINSGNTCYMNSALQCLNSVPDLVGWVHKQAKRKAPRNVLECYISLVQSMYSGRHKSVNPEDLKRWVTQSAPIFSGNRQRDAHEFMNFLLNAVQAVDSPSFPIELFHVRTQSTVTGNACEHTNSVDEVSTFLSLPVPDTESIQRTGANLSTLIKHFCQENDMDSEYYCQSCFGYSYAREKTTIVEPLPRALIIQLKRFPFDGSDRKIKTFVRYKMEYRNLISRNDLYQLSAVLLHNGSLSGGHYTAMTKHPRDGRWYRYNDSHVEKIDSRSLSTNLITSKAYVLIYLKENHWAHLVESEV